MWRQGCPVSSEWISSCSASETALCCEVFEHNNECRAVEVSHWAGLVKRGGGALSRGLGAREGSFELPHGNGPSLPRSEGCVLGELIVAGFFLFTVFTVPEKLYLWNCHSKKAFLSPWTGSDNKEEGCGERKKKQEGACDRFFVPFEFELACLDPSTFGAG